MAEFESFIAAPLEEALDKCTREQLLLLADHYEVVVTGDKRLKETIKAAVKLKLVEEGFLTVSTVLPPAGGAVLAQARSLTFEEDDKWKHV